MGFDVLSGIFIASLVMGFTPGPAIVPIISIAITHGARKTIPFSMGALLGDGVLLIATIYGLAFISGEFSWMLSSLKLVGASYLAYLGIKSLKKKDIEEEKPEGQKSFWAGFSVGVSNIKSMLFYVGFLAAFIDLSKIEGWQGLYIFFAVMIPYAVADICYILSANKVRLLFKNKGAFVAFSRFMGVFLIVLAIMVLLG